MKKRSITLPSGVVDTFTLSIVSSSSQRAFVISDSQKYKKSPIILSSTLAHKDGLMKANTNP